jgi:hypothetical protein
MTPRLVVIIRHLVMPPVAGCDNSEAELQEDRYFLRITRRLRRGRTLRPRGGSGSVGAITFAFSLL